MTTTREKLAAVDVCPRCRRRISRSGTACVVDVCAFTGSFGCEITAEAYRRGLRDGVELAREHAIPDTNYIGSGDYVGVTDWTLVDAELERRLSDG